MIDLDAILLLLELELLQTKINPHLLYNSLSVLKWNAIGRGGKEMTYIIDVLSSYYRAVLNRGNQKIAIRQEVELTKQYVAIVQFTRANRYNLTIDIPESIMNAGTIKLILQPIIENAILHGFDKKDDAQISISGYWETDDVMIHSVFVAFYCLFFLGGHIFLKSGLYAF